MSHIGCRVAALGMLLAGAVVPVLAQTPNPPGGQPSSVPAAPKLSGFPFTSESLHYTMNWQSGLPIGDVYFNANKSDKGWNFEVSGTAGVPGFAVADKYTSGTGPDFCSQELTRETSHAGKKGKERTTFDQKAGTAKRQTLIPEGGGTSTFNIGSCARDAVAYSYYVREELGQGRMPPSVQAYFGGAYTVSSMYTGSQDLMVGDKRITTDHIAISVKGPRSDFHFEAFYIRDPARTPLQIRVPLSMGTFTLDLVR